MINILKAQGHDVTVWTTSVDGNVSSAATYAGQGYELLIVDEIISSGAVGASFRGSPIPVVNWEAYIYNGSRSAFNADSGLVGGNLDAVTAAAQNGGLGSDFGQITNETQIEIVDPSHPLAAGLPAGLINVFDPSTTPPYVDNNGPGVISYAGTRTFTPNVQTVATCPGFSEGMTVFGVPAGVQVADGTTNLARWVHLPWNTTAPERVLLEDSYFLFEAGVAWALSNAQPVKVFNLAPAGGSFLPTNTIVTCVVAKTNNAGSAVASGNVVVKVNGVAAASGVSISDGGTVWNVSFTNNYQLNKSYTVVVSATSADGGLGARQITFDTFDPNNFTWEAEDFNFGGGSFFDTIVLCTNFGGSTPNCYFDRVGYTNIDESELNFTVTITIPTTNEVYRFGDLNDTIRDEWVDTFLTTDTYVRSKYTNEGIPDYEIRNIAANEWVNYTRTYPTGTYNIYARVASAAAMTSQLDLVDDATTTNQNLTKIGRFVRPGGTAGYEFVPLTDDSGATPIVVELTSTSPTTIRSSAISAGYTPNYYMLVPTAAPVNEPPTVTLDSPINRTVVNEGAVVSIQATATDADGSITNVDFYINDVVVGNDTSAPFSFDWNVPSPNAIRTDYTVKVVAADNGGLSAQSATIKVFAVDPTVVRVTADADAAFQEIGSSAPTDTGSDAGSLSLRSAFSGSAVPDIGNINEISAVRIDLTGYDVASLQDLTFNLINQRDNADRTIHFYAVVDGATGGDNNGKAPGWTDNTWDETNSASLAFSTMPGLIYTGTCTNADDRGVVPADTVDLGSAALSPRAKDSLFSFSSETLTTFLKTNADSLVTFLIVNDNNSTGQVRFGSKEQTSLDGGSPTGSSGDFGPFLSFRVAVAAPTLNYSYSGGSLTLSWSGAGYKLIAQTNSLTTGLTSSWADYPGGGASPVVVPVDTTKGTVFFGLAPQ